MITFAVSTLIFAMLVLIAAFAVIAKWLRLPYPIVFVIGGGLLALIPGLPPVTLRPDLVFLLFLPPLFYAGGITTDWRDFRRYVNPIMGLAVGLVLFTTAIVALVAHAVIGMPLAAAFVLGAVLSPPDAVATEAIAKDLPLPRAMKAILSGESLINDATALVVFRFAIAAVASGTFSLAQAGAQFVYVSIVGITIGFLGIALTAQVLIFLRRRKFADETISVLFSLITPFVVYLAAETVHASGVLAAVTAGILTAQKASRMFDYDARIAATGVWTVMTFSLNGVLFMLIGLQLRSILGGLAAYPPATLLSYGAAMSAVVIAVRFVWLYPIAVVRLKFFPKLGSFGVAAPAAGDIFVLSWAGMRGIVTLATALSIPIVAGDGGRPFPDRDLILFLAFFVIVVTLVGQGLTLPMFIRSLHMSPGDDASEMRLFARAQTAQAGLAALRLLESTFATPMHWEVAGRMRQIYESHTLFGGVTAGSGGDPAAIFARELQLATIGAEREALARLRQSGEIRDDVYRELEWDLDLLESRFSSPD